MKVVHVIDSGGFYGAEAMLVQLAKEQKNLGHSVLVLSIGSVGESDKKIEVVLYAEQVEVKRWRMPSILRPGQVRKLFLFLRHLECDVVHSHGYKGNILLSVIPKRIRKFILVSTLHGYTRHPLISKMTLYQYLDKFVLRRFDAVALVSEAMRDTMKSLGERHNTQVIKNGIEDVATKECFVSSSKSGPVDDQTLVIGSLGRLSKEKNFSLLVNAMPELLRKLPRAQLVIHGEGPERGRLLSLVEELNLESHVSILPYTTDVVGFMRFIDIFVNCSTTEGMPISLLEAMRSGKLIVATDIPANRSLLEPVDKIGVLCDSNKWALSDTIFKVNSSDLQSKTNQARVYRNEFLRHYTSRAMARKYDVLYKGAMTSFENR